MAMCTCCFEDFVALVEHEDLQVAEVEVLLLGEGQDPPRGAHDDVRGLHSLEDLDVVGNGETTVEHLSLNLRQVLSKPSELILDLVCKFSGVANNKCRAGLGVFWQLMQNGQNKHSSLAHARFSLTKDVHSNHSMRDAFLLYF
jgi:hypothetical protein